MGEDQFFEIGHISKAHANDGKVYIKLDVDNPEKYNELESVFFDMENRPIPFFIEYIRTTSNGYLVKFEDIDDRETAQSYLGTKLLLPLEDLPEPENGGFYYHELINSELIDSSNNSIVGRIDLIYDQTGQVLLGVIRNGREILIPLTDEFQPKYDREKNTLLMNLPEGLVSSQEQEL